MAEDHYEGLNANCLIIHASNIIIGVVFYLVMRPLLVQEGDPLPDKGLLNKQEPSYTYPLQISFVREYLRLSVSPSCFYIFFHLFLKLAFPGDHSYSNAFAQLGDAWTQLAFTMLIMGHMLARFLSFMYSRKKHRDQVMDVLELRGNEAVLDVVCGKGYWTCGIAGRLKAGGRVFAMDQWDTDECPFDGQWAVENSRQEEVSGRVEVMNYGDPHFLVYKDDIFDCTLCTWLETEDEINFYNLCSEMVRVTRPGGRLLFIMPYHPPNSLTPILKDLGLKEVHTTLVVTTYLMNNVVTAEKPEEMDAPPPRIDRSENAVTDESPGFHGKSMLYCMMAMGFYFVAVYTICIKYSWDSWMVPKGMAAADTMAWGFMAENTVWLCWAIVDIHCIMSERPVYIVKRIGVVNLWAAYFVQFLLMVLIFNFSTWLPLMTLSAAAGFSHVAIRAIFRVLARPMIGSTLDGFFTKRRQEFFLKTWKENYGDKKNRYRKPKKNKRKKRETDMLLDDLEGPEPEDSFAPGL